MIQFAENKVSIDLLWRVEAGAVRGRGRIEGHFDPVISSIVALGFAVCIGRQICADYHVASAQELRVVAGRIGVTARVVLANQALRDALVFIDHLPLGVFGLVSVENALRRDFFGLFPGVFEAG